MATPRLPFCDTLLHTVQQHFAECEQCRNAVDDFFRAYPVLGVMIEKKKVIAFLKGEYHAKEQSKET
ncbi:MAG: hypothetical protein WC716_16850 [Chitinophagaceae bacterium]|jgi:hypothetical protein